MQALTDSIEEFICSMLGDRDGIQIRRNELAQYFGCAPSQINYVLSTRFSIERGYLVKSKRGGGGYILVERIPLEGIQLQFYLTEQIDEQISLPRAKGIVKNLFQHNIISQREFIIISSALKNVPMIAADMQDHARAFVLKNMLIAVLEGQCSECKQT